MKCPAITGVIAFAYAMRGTDALIWSSSRGNAVTTMDIADNETSSRDSDIAAMEFDDIEAEFGEQVPQYRRLRPRDDPFNYFRIPKTGSTTVYGLLFDAKARHTEACEKIQWNGHNFFPGDKEAEGRTFTVIRNPCERYLSQWDHIRTKNIPGHPTFDSCRTGLDEFGMQQLQSPITWAQYLLRNESIRNMYMDRHYVYPKCRSMIAMWHQSKWVGENTYVACLPSMIEDFNSFLAKEAPGCVFEVPEKEMHNGRAHPKEMRHNDEVCELAKQLYADDVTLWNDRCGARHGSV